MITIAKKKQTVSVSDALFPDNSTDMFSLFDEQFSVAAFHEAIASEETKSERIISLLRNAVKEQTEIDEEKDEPKLVVVLTEQQRQDYREGKLKLDKVSSDEYYAQFRDRKGRYSDKLTIKEELQEQGISTEEIRMALQMDAIREQLESVLDTLKSIEDDVEQVILGQHNDRVGLYYSGISLYIEAKEVNDEAMRRLLESQALKSISDANSQMIQELRASIEYLKSKKYRKLKNATEKIEEHLSIIRQCYGIIYRAMLLKAMIYFDRGEIAAMLTAIDEYSRFVEKLIVPYVGRLSELDRNDQLIEEGTWGTISQTLAGCRGIRAQIASNNVYELPLKGELDAG